MDTSGHFAIPLTRLLPQHGLPSGGESTHHQSGSETGNGVVSCRVAPCSSSFCPGTRYPEEAQGGPRQEWTGPPPSYVCAGGSGHPSP